jgi:hypothetical protein
VTLCSSLSRPYSNSMAAIAVAVSHHPAAAQALNELAETNLSRREWGRMLEALKGDLGLPNNHHGKITSMGDYLDQAGEFLGNLLEYLP